MPTLFGLVLLGAVGENGRSAEGTVTPAERFKVLYVEAAQAFARNEIEKAQLLAEQAEQAQPGQANTANLLGAIATRKRDWPKAMAEFRRALQLQPDLPMARFNLAEVMFLSRQYFQAKIEFEKFLSQEPGNDLGQYKVFLCELLMGNRGQAEIIALRLRDRECDLAYAYARAAEAFVAGDRQTGLALLQKAKQESPCGPHATFADSLVELGFLRDS